MAVVGGGGGEGDELAGVGCFLAHPADAREGVRGGRQ